MKRYLCYFTTMLLVLVFTDMCLGGSVFRNGHLSARISGVNEKEMRQDELKEMDSIIAARSCEFVRAAFNLDRAAVCGMLSEDAEYIVAEDNSSYIRYSSGDFAVEGYMATDKKLSEVRQNWHVAQDDGTITSGVEVTIEGEKSSQIWYIHYRNSLGQWKIYMLENGI